MWCTYETPESDYFGGVKHARYVVAACMAALIALGGAAGLVRGAKSQMTGVERIEEVAADLATTKNGFENYLLVGSDSREGIDPTAADFDVIGSSNEVGGQRSDTIMIMRYDSATKSAALMSFPRDLWVTIGNGNKHNRINSAYNLGPGMLARTVTANFGIPIHHYLEVNFQGFKDLVDAIGGVQICTPYQVRDRQIGLQLRRGCQQISGMRALRYARSRHYEERIDGKWRLEGTGDIGRSNRQRDFVAAMLKQTAKHAASHPFGMGEIISSITKAIHADPSLDMPTFVKRMKPAADGSIASYPLEVYQDTEAGMAVVKLGGASQQVIDYFNGTGPAPGAVPAG